MTTSSTPDYRILTRLLTACERETLADDSNAAASSAASHVSSEQLALFADNALSADERQQVIEHLSHCRECRQTASVLLTLVEEEAAFTANDPSTSTSKIASPAEAAPSRIPRRWFSAPIWYAAAALLLVAVTLVLMYPRETAALAERRVFEQVRQLLVAGRFEDARREVAEAVGGGVQSERLASLDAQAIRRHRNPLALGAAGKLTDVGFDIGGVAARSVEDDEAKRLAAAAAVEPAQATSQRLVELNRGHLALSRGQTDAAREIFQRLTDQEPGDAWGWLGLGMADYAGGNYAEGEQAFSQALMLQPGLLEAAFNRAMTLEELDRYAEAATAWRTVLTTHSMVAALSPDERQRIERHLAELDNLQQK